MTANDGRIYIVLQAKDKGELSTYIQVYDGDGKLLEEKEVDALDDYGTMNCTSFFTHNDYYFIRYYYASDHGMSPRAIVKETDGSFDRVYYSGQAPVWPTHEGLVRDRYVIFMAGADNSDYSKQHFTHQLIVFDTIDGAYWYVDLPKELYADFGAYSVREFACQANSNGDLFVDIESSYPGEGIAVISGDDLLGVAK
jgi:hypothetical protein